MITAEILPAGESGPAVLTISVKIAVAALPERAAQLAIVNKEPTPCDDRAAVVINEMAGRVLTDVLAALGKI